MYGNYSREETIQERKLYEEIRYLNKGSHDFHNCFWVPLNTLLFQKEKNATTVPILFSMNEGSTAQE